MPVSELRITIAAGDLFRVPVAFATFYASHGGLRAVVAARLCLARLGRAAQSRQRSCITVLRSPRTIHGVFGQFLIQYRELHEVAPSL